MRVLVTGSSGAIGSAIAARVRRDAVVVGLDLQAGPETTHVGDIADRELIRDAMRGATAVVHTAALHVPHLATASDADFERVNVEGTRELLEAAAAERVPRFVLTSTTSVYGCSDRRGPPATWADESLTPRPADAYDRTKLAAEALCRDVVGRGLSTVVLRMGRCFPEPDHLMAFYRMYRGVDLRDVAEAHWRAVVAPLERTVTLNVAAPTPFQRDDVVQLWDDAWSVIDRRVPGVRSAFERRGWPLPPRIDRVYAGDAAGPVLGFSPRHGIEDLLLASAG